MKFNSINCPRTENGGFGPVRCENCDGRSTAYLEIEFEEQNFKVVLCKGCLLNGVEIINNTMLEDCVRKGKK